MQSDAVGTLRFKEVRESMKTDVVIVGAGPAGIFTAIEMLRKDSAKKIVIVEKGKSVGKPSLPQGQNAEVYELQALLSHHDGVFGRGRVFGRQAVFKQ